MKTGSAMYRHHMPLTRNERAPMQRATQAGGMEAKKRIGVTSWP